MLILLNLCIILTLLIMIAIWATYGFFSAFIQLIVIIAAGVLAFALWEPVSYMLLGTMPAYAHGVGLLAPFALLVIVLRTVFDKVCRANVHMPRIADQIGGAACGFCSGVLAIGLLLNGANFLPMQREIMGWEPYKVAGNELNENPDGKLWGVTRVNEWSANFFNMVSTGSMSPTGGTPLAVGRPDLAKRAILTRLPADEHQFRTAHPGSVQVTGVYAMPATEDAVFGLAHRSAILAFLDPSYELPKDIELGEDGMGMVNAILNEMDARFVDPSKGKASEMIDVQSIMEVARTPQYKFEGATSQKGFPLFVKMVADKMGSDMVARLGSKIDKEKKTSKVLFVVDTAWNNKYPGTFNPDGTLRIAIPQVSLGIEGKTVAPIGYSIQYNQNTGGRIFTEIISEQADVSTRDAAYSKYTEVNIGWVFALDESKKPERFYVRELRFDLNQLEKPEGQETIVNLNPGAVARVIGAPLLPTPADLDDTTGTTNIATTGGTKLAGSDIYADVSEKLPGSFAAAASSLELDKTADPWVLKSGRSEKVISGRGGKRSSVSEIWVQGTFRLVRLKLDGQKAKSLYGRILGKAQGLSVMKVKDDAGNYYDSVGYALQRADRTMNIDIREDAFNRGVSATELPDVKPGETLMVYFQVPIGKKLKSVVIGTNDERDFEELLVVTADEK